MPGMGSRRLCGFFPLVLIRESRNANAMNVTRKMTRDRKGISAILGSSNAEAFIDLMATRNTMFSCEVVKLEIRTYGRRRSSGAA